jgi:hypothetical protein
LKEGDHLKDKGILEDIIKTDLIKTGCMDINYFTLVQDRNK